MFEAPWGSEYLSEWYSDKSDLSSADPVPVTAAATTALNVSLTRGGVARVT